jgi:hypothetical protein
MTNDLTKEENFLYPFLLTSSPATHRKRCRGKAAVFSYFSMEN